MLPIATMWLRVELRRRWRPLLLLTLIVTLTTGALLACLAGAVRGATALDRLVATSLPATAVVHTNQEAIDYWPRVRQLPGVAAVSTFPAYSGFSVDEAQLDPVGAYLPLDADAMRSVERPVVLSGRLADPARADEVVVTQRFTDVTGLGVGDRVTLRLFTALEINTGVSAVRTTQTPRPSGPAIPATIVGTIRSPWFSDPARGIGQLIPSPGLAAAYPENILGAALDSEAWALVRLTDGDAGLRKLRDQLSSLVTITPVDVLPRSDAIEHLRDVTRFQAACLLGVCAAILLAGAFVGGAAVTRQVAATREDLRMVNALGATRAQAVVLSAAGPMVAGAAGAVLGAVAAVAGSGWFPFGMAAALEPSPGLQVDAIVLVPGAVLVAAAVAGWALLISAFLHQTRTAPSRVSGIARAGAGSGLPVPIVVGLRHALEPGSGRAAIPVRSAMAGAIAGVLGVVGGLTFAAGVDDAASSPQRFGEQHQLIVAFGYNGTDLSCVPRAMTAISAEPAVESVVDLRFQTARLTTGPAAGQPGPTTAQPATQSNEQGLDRTLTVFTAPRPSAQSVLVQGRAATGPDDIVLAPATAERLGATVGSQVPLEGQLPGEGYGGTAPDVPPDPCVPLPQAAAGPPAPELPAGEPAQPEPAQVVRATLTVSGIGFVPQTEYNEYDQGAWVSPATYQRLFGTGFVNHMALLGLRPGTDAGQVAERLDAAFASIPNNFTLFISYPSTIDRAGEMADLRDLPLVLCVFLAVLGLAATGHVLLVSVHRRSGEFAVLRALGMTPRQARRIPTTQAVVYALAGLAAGVPLGLAAGRLLWRLVSDQTPLLYRPPGLGWSLVTLMLLTVVAALVLAFSPARRVAVRRIAEVLRAE